MEKKTTGSWIVHHNRKLHAVNAQGQFGQIKLAGKSGIMLSAIAADDEVTLSRNAVESLAQANDIDQTFELDRVLGVLQARGYIDQSGSGSEIVVLGVTTPRVLEYTADIFSSLNPTAEEHASLTLAEMASVEPVEADHVREHLSDYHKIPRDDAADFIQRATRIGFTDAEPLDSDRTLLFNGNLFRKAAPQKTRAVLDSLSSKDRERVQTLQTLLSEVGCLPYERVTKILGGTLFLKLNSIGLYDLSEVSNDFEARLYVTLPAAFNKYSDPTSDAFDLAKAFVASLTYGMERSTPDRGRISILHRLIAKLIRGEWVGPATAIGQDYTVLEMRGVLEVKRERHSYSMRLLKREVGVLAQQVLLEGDASATAVITVPRSNATSFRGPESQREITRKKDLGADRKALSRILDSVRTGRSVK